MSKMLGICLTGSGDMGHHIALFIRKSAVYFFGDEGGHKDISKICWMKIQMQSRCGDLKGIGVTLRHQD